MVHLTVVDRETQEVVLDLGTLPERKADRVFMGASRNLDHERYYIREEDVADED